MEAVHTRHRLLCAQLAFVAFTVSGIPLALVLETWLPSVAALVLATGTAAAIGSEPAERESRPSRRAVTVALLIGPFWSSAATLLGLAVYSLTTVVVRLANTAFGTRWSAEAAAMPAGIVVGALLVCFCAVILVADVVGECVPASPGTMSLYDQAAAASPRQIHVIAVLEAGALVVAGLVLVLPWDVVSRTPVGLVVLALLALFGLVVLGSTPPTTKVEDGVVAATEACRSALAEAGFEITMNPRVEDPAVDDLLDEVKILAERADRSFAIRFLTTAEGEHEIGWRAAPEVIVAAQALSRRGAETSGVSVEPLLVLVDGEPSGALMRLRDSSSITVVVVRSGEDGFDLAALDPILRRGTTTSDDESGRHRDTVSPAPDGREQE